MRILITGVGLLSPIGNSFTEFSDSLRNGDSGFAPITAFDTTEFPYDRGAIISEAPDAFEAFVANRPGWETAQHYGAFCASRALADAGLSSEDLDPFRTAVVVASSNAGVETNQAYAEQSLAGTLETGATIVRTPGTVAASIRSEFGLRGPQASVSTACAAGSNSVGLACDLIAAGHADLALAGGAEPFSMLSYSGFTLLKSLTHDALRPFDELRDGTGLGEAACMFVLESEASALARGASVYGEVAGYGLSDDAHHATAPDPSGRGAELAIRQCLEQAGVLPADVDYVNAHGTGTRYNDVMELTALRSVFGDGLRAIPVSSTKPLHGHTLSCAGSIELLACLAAMDGDFVPGNFGLREAMSGFEDLELPTRTLEDHRVDVAISTSFGFGGNNTCIAVRSFRPPA
ncbi:beta-ketoacyl-[acyl-carrier-protein] synthase family protein [Pseudoclavibacter sp. AY1H1]|uniref:beta-ketoacyl-[acyl-carrier-protein] synthase family protein n=1 Tax=Pseudoclavibacter sp. AY1H1 TaxID=2080584 RepID=UPI0015E349F9|nr:beta-ketoacyl-[acyl-carrier-protein] synthase family protein [Pseudoclavibacter sp. AY1H1]